MNKGKQGIIYKYTNINNGKIYIGQTTEEKVRKYKHRKEAFKEGGKFSKAICQHGFENFTYEVLFRTVETENLEQLKRVLDTMEIAYIKFYDSYRNGYNATLGGGGIIGYKHSEETKQKMSKTHMGKTMSEEAKRNISESRKRLHIHLSDEAKQNISRLFSKPISQFSKDNKFIQDWNSITEATNELELYPGGISKVCNGKLKTCGGYIWKYKKIEIC